MEKTFWTNRYTLQTRRKPFGFISVYTVFRKKKYNNSN